MFTTRSKGNGIVLPKSFVTTSSRFLFYLFLKGGSGHDCIITLLFDFCDLSVLFQIVQESPAGNCLFLQINSHFSELMSPQISQRNVLFVPWNTHHRTCQRLIESWSSVCVCVCRCVWQGVGGSEWVIRWCVCPLWGHKVNSHNQHHKDWSQEVSLPWGRHTHTHTHTHTLQINPSL